MDGELGVTQSFHIGDDLLEIATSVIHPMVDYSGQKKGQSFASMVDKTWARMSGSSVWLDKYQVYLTVTRVFFYDKGVKHWPVINFIRAQLHDADWNHLENHEIEWQGEIITFPRMLPIDSPFIEKGAFYGPEDPRIIVEKGVENAEPVVIFNMISDLATVRRQMHAYRPFSNFTTAFKIENEAPKGAEKNWAPFFVPEDNQHLSQHRHGRQYPSKYIHFVYEFYPLRILKCHLLNGACTFVYNQPQPSNYTEAHKHNDTQGVMRGGTNFEPLPASLQTRPGLTSFIAMPRTHTDGGCGKEATYRPEFMVLTTNGTTFYLDYASEALNFGTALLTPEQAGDVCDKGRILIANSIARIHDDKYGKNKDSMVVSFSVDDSTVQVAKVIGVQQLLGSIPQFQYRSVEGLELWKESDMVWNQNVTSDVLLCSIQSATDYAVANTRNDTLV